MTEARFLQIHTLHSYSSVLLNRDDSGLAKRLPYGGVMRTRISSQCLKRHWRIAEDPHALAKIAGATDAFRSRELVTQKVIKPLSGTNSGPVLEILEDLFQRTVYGEKGTTRQGRQTLLFGAPELTWLASQAAELAPKIDAAIAGTLKEIGSEPSEEKARKKHRDDRLKKCQKAAEQITKEWSSNYAANIKVLREQALHGGLAAALFGRMVTSDPAANIDAPIHVAHAFTVHGEETESDYLTAVDDLKDDDDDQGADTIQEAELTSGLFYGYVVVDIPGLVSNTTGCERKDWLDPKIDRTLAADVVHNLLYLIAEVSPGAKLGSTAPYGRAELLLIESGDRQPRSLSPAFREAVSPNIGAAQSALAGHLSRMDRAYETGEARRALHLLNEDLPGAPRGSLREIAAWAKAAVKTGAAT
jgi:CRISPR system Cascade subunit CasC